MLVVSSCQNNEALIAKTSKDGKINGECVFSNRTNVKNDKDIVFTEKACSIKLSDIKRIADYCVAKRAERNMQIANHKQSLEHSLNKYKNQDAEYISEYDATYKKLKDEILGDDMEIIKKFDLSNVDEDAAYKYFSSRTFKEELLSEKSSMDYSYTLKEVPGILTACDIDFLHMKGKYYDAPKEVQPWD